MKRVAALLLLFAIVIASSFAQEEPIPPKRSKAAKIGGLGGFTPSWLFVDVKEVNSFLKGGGGTELKDDGVFLTGGAGAAYIMIVPNLRVGGMGVSGTLKSTRIDNSLPINVRRDAELSVSFGGVTVEYVLPIAERFDFAVGTLLGGGGLDLTVRKSTSGTTTWGIEQGNFGGTATSQNTTAQYNGAFFVAVPSANFEYAITGWIGVRLGASYVTMFSPTWKKDGEFDLIGVPSSVKGSGFMINAGVFVGTF